MSMYNFRKVGGLRKFRAWKEWSEGEFVVGKIVAFAIDSYKHRYPQIQVLETNVKDFKVGETVDINYTGGIDYKLNEAEVGKGDIVRFEYLGTGTMPKGPFKGKEFHDVEVSVAEEESRSSSKKHIADDSEYL